MPVNPYFLGLWLGDGTSYSTTISNNNEIVSFLSQHAEGLGLQLTRTEGTVEYRTVSGPGAGANVLLNALRELGVVKPPGVTGPENDRKHIPKMYLEASEAVRLQLLAGLIDSDGSYVDISRKFRFAQAERWHKTLFMNVVYLARSLGFNANYSRTWREAHWDESLQHFMPAGWTLTTYIFGDIHRVPTLLPRKQARDWSNKDWFVHSVVRVVQKEQPQAFAGFLVDGNKRFLRSDFLVVHNSSFEDTLAPTVW